MKASKLIECLQSAVAESGDHDVEFFCEPRVNAMFRPVDQVGTSSGRRNGATFDVVLLAPAEDWLDQKLADRNRRDTEMAEVRRSHATEHVNTSFVVGAAVGAFGC